MGMIRRQAATLLRGRSYSPRIPPMARMDAVCLGIRVIREIRGEWIAAGRPAPCCRTV
jgi:hypothetical protein